MRKIWIVVFIMTFIACRAFASDHRFQMSILTGINHVYGYGSAADYVLGENYFPMTPAHTLWSFGASFGYFLGKNLGVELEGRFYLSSKMTLEDPGDKDTVDVDSSRHFSVTANLLYQFPNKKIIPYIIGGIGFDFLLAEDSIYTSHYGYAIDFVAPEEKLDFLVNAGTGIKLMLIGELGMRVDIRYVVILDEPYSIHNLSGMIGAFYKF